MSCFIVLASSITGLNADSASTLTKGSCVRTSWPSSTIQTPVARTASPPRPIIASMKPIWNACDF